jgi:hypothetical protein
MKRRGKKIGEPIIVLVRHEILKVTVRYLI